MNTSNERSYGWVALILGILLLFVLYLLLTTRSDLRRATSEFRGDLSAYSNELIKKCTLTATTTAAERNECERVWEDFGDTIKDYGKAIVTVVPTSTPPAVITTPTSTPSVDRVDNTATTSTTTLRATTTLEL